MPVPGGSSDKIGNRYEALWVVHELLRVLSGDAEAVTVELIDPEQSRGVEFTVQTTAGIVEFWSVKRQHTKALGWSLSTLTKREPNGRSILGDLIQHVERDSRNRAVFASSLAARDLAELTDSVGDSSTLRARLARSDDLSIKFETHLMPLWDGDLERATTFLQRITARTVDENSLRWEVQVGIRRTFFQDGGRSLDPEAVQGLLTQLVLDRIHQATRRAEAVAALASHGIHLRAWATDSTVHQRIGKLADDYSASLSGGQINGRFLEVEGSAPLFQRVWKSSQHRLLLAANAGGGKSTTLGELVERAKRNGTPVLPIRFDQLGGGIATTLDLGGRLGLTESPAVVLAGVAGSEGAILIADQLDAISLASGRNPEVWAIFEDLLRELKSSPQVSIVVACREFDLEHDHRMHRLATAGTFETILLSGLSPETVDRALRDAMVDPKIVDLPLRDILTTPLHLSMFLGLESADRAFVTNRETLFDHFWVATERRVVHRLKRPVQWTTVIDTLVDCLSERQMLSAPISALDNVRPDAAAMASEHLLIYVGGRVSFFHETFFDYAFARRFAASRQSIAAFLFKGEQLLFRRAQVRQVLSYLRAQDHERYLAELKELLETPAVRFHIKASVLQSLAALPDPWLEEWKILLRIGEDDADLGKHVLSTVAGRPAWFDVLDRAGYFESCLRDADSERQWRATWMMALPETMRHRSDRVAELLDRHRQATPAWTQLLRHVCRLGNVHRSRKMFDFFLTLLDEGVLDELRPGVAVNDSWWSVLYLPARESPAWACEAIGRWLDRSLHIWREKKKSDGPAESLYSVLDRGQHAQGVIEGAGRDHSAFAREMFPRVAKIVSDLATEREGYLDADGLWSFRVFRGQGLQVHSMLLDTLARALEAIAQDGTGQLDELLDPVLARPHDTIAYLVLRAWTAAPTHYGDRIAGYLAEDQRRLRVGYSSAPQHVSIQAVSAASAVCSLEKFALLEAAILGGVDRWESRNPAQRGRTQLALLQALDPSRISSSAKQRLGELRRKFPEAKAEVPKALQVRTVGSPVPATAFDRMSDAQLIGAMRQYAGLDDFRESRGELQGGQDQLAYAIQKEVPKDPTRFVRVAEQMADDLPGAYFCALVRGMTEKTDAHPAGAQASVDQLSRLLRRVHSLPERPAGREVAYLLMERADLAWPEDIVDFVAWYATNDSDPAEEAWRSRTSEGVPYHRGDPYTSGMNSVRGAACLATARLISSVPARYARLRPTVFQLVRDKNVGVRACALGLPLVILGLDVKEAIQLFSTCIEIDPVLWGAPQVQQFIRGAGYRDYLAVRPIVQTALAQPDEAVVFPVGRQVHVLAFDSDEAQEDALQLQSASTSGRRAAAHVYAANVSDETVGQRSRELLQPFFRDDDPSVRAEAVGAFAHLATMSAQQQEELLRPFVDAGPKPDDFGEVMRSLEEAPILVPELVCDLADKAVVALKGEAGDISTSSAAVGMDISKIVIRLYAQAGSSEVRRRCLDLIDKMERSQFFGLSDELMKLER